MNTDRLPHILFQLRREWLPRGNREELEAEITRGFKERDDRITELEAQLDALKNPPYRIDIEAPEGGFSDCGYQYTIYPQRAAVKVNDGFETEAEARAEAQQFIDKLTAPFAPKA